MRIVVVLPFLFFIPHYGRMAFFTIVYRKRYSQMAYAAKFFFKYIFHGEILGGLLLYIENVRMTVCTIQPLNMGIMWKNCRWYKVPGGFKFEEFVEFHGFLLLVKNTINRCNFFHLECPDPINFISGITPWGFR